MSVRKRLMRLTSGAAAATLIATAFVGVGAAPAHADTSVTGFGNGAVGVVQVINGTGVCANTSATLTVEYVNGPTITTNPVLTNSQGGLQLLWTPTVVGQIRQGTLGFGSCPPIALGGAIISQVATSTTISTPNTVRVGTATTVNVSVQSQSPSTNVPTGQVVIRDAGGATVATLGLTRNNNATGQAVANWRWTPPSEGVFTFQATYNGDTNSLSSVSPVDVVAATQSGGTISLTSPATTTAGVPVLLTATVFPSNTQGSAGFTFNGAPISASVPFVNGVATFLWTPTVVGAGTVGVNYMSNGGRSGNTSAPINVVAGPVSFDVITLTQPGVGPWAPNGVYTLGNGTSFTFQASTLSGAPVTLTNSGPCNQSGLTLTIDTGSGSCQLVASSPGGPGFAPVKQGYTVNMVPGTQTAALAAPPSGRFPKGRTIRLQNPSQGVTNAGQNISWRITNGSNRCRLRFPSNGAVNVQLQRPGQCTVQARAAAVPNAWAAFRLQRTYTAR